ncbi:uncharacterized protein B0I36DRAFT_433710 [Microdochium trichocladiopsis]|uniref:Uncharacterized protein n=1 Tax=Microdochium trichocladiopsis TaxID=1682393 RepID=A0A9P8Y0F0_9PEZI|nr:uncharacterized protein B0I36DRAFT_433710 [Microdochium trichocladiopsis]KAH7026211.1 hypothetical protein B0I36DRAFT_433710 [Microdochium trichocladiopsis]
MSPWGTSRRWAHCVWSQISHHLAFNATLSSSHPVAGHQRGLGPVVVLLLAVTESTMDFSARPAVGNNSCGWFHRAVVQSGSSPTVNIFVQGMPLPRADSFLSAGDQSVPILYPWAPFRCGLGHRPGPLAWASPTHPGHNSVLRSAEMP